MPMNRNDGPKTPEQLFDERTALEDARRIEREEGDDLQNEIRAETLGLDHTLNGKPLRRLGRHHDRDKKLHDAIMSGTIGGGIASKLIEGIISAASSLLPTPSAASGGATSISSAYNDKVVRKGVQPVWEDKDYLYDSMNVSDRVYKKLMQESEEITDKIAQCSAAKEQGNLKLVITLQEQIEDMAQKYEMRAHPMTGVYVHDFNRVLREEQQDTLRGQVHYRPEHLVCVFVLKGQISEFRGIKAKIADQFDQDPREAVASGDHRKGHDRFEPTGP